MSKTTTRAIKTRTPRPRVSTTSKRIAVTICDCGEIISDGNSLCINCEIELEEFNGISMKDLEVLEALLAAQEEEVAV